MNRNFIDQLYLDQFKTSKYYLIIFILWPFLAFLVGIANYSRKEARLIVYLFIIYYGLSFVNTNPAVDAYRYVLDLKANAQRPFSDFFKIVGGLYSDTNVDIIEPFISFIVSRFTDHHAVYFGIWTAIFGFFYLKSIWLLHEHSERNRGWNTTVLIVFFILTIPVTMITGVRMYTAAWIFFYGAYRVVTERNPKFLIVALSASLVHWSFITANGILLIYFFLGNRNIIYFPLALISFVVPYLAGPFFRSLALKAGGGLQKRYEGYSGEAYVEAMREAAGQAAWFIRIGNNLVFYYLLLALVLTYLNKKSIIKDGKEKNLFSFILLFIAFVNFGMPIPSFGERFIVIFFLFATAYLFLYYSKLSGTKLSILILLGLFPMMLYSLIAFRIGSESINAWILSPGLGMPFVAPVLSLAEILFS